jgi:hypothetical protein
LRIKVHSNGNVELKNFGLFFSTSILFDSDNLLIWVNERSWGFHTQEEVYKFSSIDFLRVRCVTHYDEGTEYYVYCLEIINLDSNAIWSCDTENESHFRELSILIRERLDITTNSKSLEKHTDECQFCNRTISPISAHCIYCGEKRHNQTLESTQKTRDSILR